MRIKGVKRLYTYILQVFIPLLTMTFFICWFVVLLQFLWRYIDEMVGKGLSVSVVAQLMFYAAMHLIPMALPLGILLASLMTFGNLGERLELLAMKSAGVPLHKIMMPLFVAVMFLAISLFIFQNDYMITSQVRMWTILYSARQAQPELEIPEGAFYNGIGGYNIYVKSKDHKTGLLKDVIIYDHSQGFNNMRVINADSGRLKMDVSKTFLTFSLYGGQSFENLESQEYDPSGKPIAYVKENFKKKQIIIPFDANFNMMDEKEMGSLYVGKNLWQLNQFIDSVSVIRDSISKVNSNVILNQTVSMRYTSSMPSVSDTSSYAREYRTAVVQGAQKSTYRLDSLSANRTTSDSLQAVNRAISDINMQLSELTSRKFVQESENIQFRSNSAEKHRKFTFPVACIVFFFIGAPLGAIIRKGGLGTPIVASVVLFVIYYMIDTFGYRMAKAGDLEVWQGMWLSTAVLFPVGVFLTYKASRDSSTLNIDSWIIWLKKVFGHRPPRRITFKELIITPAEVGESMQRVLAMKEQITAFEQTPLMQKPFYRLLLSGSEQAQATLSANIDELIEYLRNSTNTLVVLKLMDIPVIPTHLSKWIRPDRKQAIALMALLPLSIVLSLYLMNKRRILAKDLEAAKRQADLILEILTEEKTKTN